jgi:hypothetical protein
MTRTRAIVLTVGAAVLGAAAVFQLRVSRADAERTPYTIVWRDGRFEVREYPELSLATTTLDADRDGAAFRRLFRFIDRSNARREKIAMTTPVLVGRREPLPGTMSFVMPERLRVAGTPAPVDETVRLQTRPAQRVAVYRYAGRTSARNERDATARLREWMAAQALRAEGEPEVAYYDAPYLVPFLRRNEVMLRVS